jgi:hypothetical protein
MKTGRDIKFVIYQVLYIFVVCVIALKGADINLEEVIDTTKAEPKEVADKLRRQIDSLMALLGKNPEDTTKKYTEAEMQAVLAMLKDKEKQVSNGNGITSNPITGNGPGITTSYTGNSEIKDDNVIKTKEPTVPEFTQYTLNSVKNSFDKDLDIYGDGIKITTIKSQSTGTLKINSEKVIKFEVDGKSSSKPTKEKQSPKIDIQKVGLGGPDASLRSIQNSIGFRVTIISNYPGDLDVKISGPVSKAQVKSNIFDVTLSLLGSETAFDAWSKGKEEPFRASFTVSVKDKYNPKLNISQIGVFTFGKW